MAQTTELMAAGLPPALAQMLGQDPASALSAAGTTQATATAISAAVNFVTTVATGSGVVLPTASAKTPTAVVNGGANPLTVYPAVGEILNNLSANVGVVIAPNKSGFFIPSGTKWAVNLSA